VSTVADLEGAPGRDELPVPARDRPSAPDRGALVELARVALEPVRRGALGSLLEEFVVYVVDLDASRERPPRGGPMSGRVEEEVLCLDPERPTVAAP
jgi:hypothetical protein